MKTTPNSTIKRFLVVASVALAIPLSAAAFGGNGGKGSCGMDAHGGPGHQMMGGNSLPQHLRSLNLNDAQQDKVFEIMHAQAPAMREKAKSLRAAESDLRALSAAPDFSEAKAAALADSAAKAMSELSLARAKADRQVYEVLTPEQRKQLAESKPSGKMSHHRGNRAAGERGMGQGA